MVASRQNPLPNKLPSAPEEYEVSFFNQLNRQIERILNELNQPALAKAGSLFLDINSLPTSGYGLRQGMVYRDGSTLKIVLDGSAFTLTNTATVSLGTITVTV